jgi:hypothetical protein
LSEILVEHPRARSLIPSVRSAVRPVTCVSVDKFNAIEALIATSHLILSRKFDLISIVSDIFLLPRTISLTAMAALTYFSTPGKGEYARDNFHFSEAVIVGDRLELAGQSEYRNSSINNHLTLPKS